MKYENYISSLFTLCGLFLSLSLINGCGLIGGEVRKEVNSISEVGRNQVVIVGRVELTPDLREGEQHIEAGSVDVMGWADLHKDRAMLQVNKTPVQDESHMVMINPKLGETFHFEIAKDTPYIVGGSIMLEHRFEVVGWSMLGNQMHADKQRIMKEIRLPSMFKLDIRPEDKAIYVGTIRLHRDEFNSVTKIDIVDDYEATNKRFQVKFGQNAQLRKAIVKSI